MKGNTLILALSAGLVFNGCTAKIEGGSNPPPAPPADSWFSGKPAVQGPNVEGEWDSGCVSTGYYYKNRKLSIKGASYERIDGVYNDSACTQVQSTYPQRGEFRFVKNHGDGSYDLETRVPIGQGALQYFEALLSFKDGTLALSDDKTEAGLRELPMKKAEAKNPKPPVTQPGQPTPPAPPANPSCVNYVGTYEASYSSTVTLTQDACKSVTWSSGGVSTTYVMDGVAREGVKATANNGRLLLEKTDSYGDIWQYEFALTKQPCNSGYERAVEHLERRTRKNGVELSYYCNEYKRLQ